MLATKNKYIHKEVTTADIENILMSGMDISPLLKVLKYYKNLKDIGISKTDPNFFDSTEYHKLGNQMASICKNKDLVKFAAQVLRHAYCNGASMNKYDLDFIQGIEAMAAKGQKFTRKQSWQLGMILTDYLEF
jgi:hypothetical protein